MRASIVRASLALSTLLVAPALVAQQPTVPAPMPMPAPSVEAGGYGEVRITPDRAVISVGVETRAPTAAAASAQNARLQRAVIDTIRALGVASAQIATVDYSVYPEQVFNPERGDTKPRITGYVVRNTVRVEVRKLEQVSSLIDAAIAKGANGINSLQFLSSNVEEARRRALAEAVKNAEADARAMAGAAGRCVQELVELTTQQARGPSPMDMRARGAVMAMAEAAPTPVEPGEQVVSATVIGRWRLSASGESCQTR
jgi:uncharacterized protein YggE